MKLYSNCGVARTSDGRTVVDVQRGETGCVLYGPFVALPRGRYVARFTVSPALSKSELILNKSIASPCCKVDVIRSAGARVLVEKELAVRDVMDAQGRVSIEFEVAEEGVHEFRLFSLGGVAMSVVADRTLSSDRNYLFGGRSVGDEDLLPLDPQEVPEFVLAGYAILAAAAKAGARIRCPAGQVDFSMDGVDLRLEHSDDIQLVDELFLINQYSYFSPRPRCVLDIGMNAGFSVAMFAAQPICRKVYGFEPFASPYGRAVANVARNAAVAHKVKTFNFGLSDRNERMSVNFDPASTIGTSIRGRDAGAAVEIEVRDCAEVLAPILQEAREAGLEVMLKMDCEGSEFAIVDRLAETGLLGKIDAIIMEWHKWWSKDKTQYTIIDRLLESGFVAFDRTSVVDEFAGIVIAVRRPT